MSWFGQQVLTREEVLTDALNDEIPSNLGPGDECTIFMQLDQENPRLESLEAIDGYVVGVSIHRRHATYYDIAVPIKGTLFYAVLNDVRGWVCPRGETTDPENGGLVSLASVDEAMKKPENKRRFFKVVEKTDEDDQDQY